MIFQLLQSGAMSLIDGNNTVYQGSNNATTLFVIANVAPPTGLQIAFTYPDGTVSDTAVPMYLEGDGAIEGTNGYVWSYKLPYRVTEVEGTVGVSINVVNNRTTYINNQTTYTATIEVVYSVLPAPQAEYSQTDWQQVLDLLTNYYSWVQTMGDRTKLTTADKTTLVAAINEVNAKIATTAADLATETAARIAADNGLSARIDTAQATADGANNTAQSALSLASTANNTANTANATANNAKTTAENAQATANRVVPTANTALTNSIAALSAANVADTKATEAKQIAEGKSNSDGRATLEEAINAINAFTATERKIGDNFYIRQQGVPDLWVSAVSATSVPYVYTSVEDFNNLLLANDYVQIGYYEMSKLDTLDVASSIAWQNMPVIASDFKAWTPTADLIDYPLRASIDLTGYVDYSTITFVVFSALQATSGVYAPTSDTYNGGVYVYAKEVPKADITIPTIITFRSNVSGGGVNISEWKARGLWINGGSYKINDIVYDNAGIFYCKQNVVSAIAPENDTTNFDTVYRYTNPLPVGGVPYAVLAKNNLTDYNTKWQLVPLLVTTTEMLNALTTGGFVDLQIVTPEDDNGYELGHLYQFHITGDVYSWTDITPPIGAIGSKISGSFPMVWIENPSNYSFTIYNPLIKVNSFVEMFLSDNSDIQAYSKTDGSVTVIRDTVPTTAIPYELQIIETSNEGVFKVDNAYKPTFTQKQSDWAQLDTLSIDYIKNKPTNITTKHILYSDTTGSTTPTLLSAINPDYPVYVKATQAATAFTSLIVLNYTLSTSTSYTFSGASTQTNYTSGTAIGVFIYGFELKTPIELTSVTSYKKETYILPLASTEDGSYLSHDMVVKEIYQIY